MSSIVSKFFNSSHNQYQEADPRAPLTPGSWESEISNSVAVRVLRSLVDANRNEMASDHSRSRKFVTSSVQAAFMGFTAVCVAIPEATFHIGASLVAAKLHRKTESETLLAISAIEAARGFGSLTAIGAGLQSAYDCLTKKEDLELKTYSNGLLDLREASEDASSTSDSE